MTDLPRQLYGFDLSEKQTRVYQALLGMGPARADEVAREAKLNRSTSYTILKSLTVAGLIFETHGTSGILTYEAISPEHLVKRADNLVLYAERREKQMETLMPELLSLSHRLKHQPRVLFYEGVAGLVTAEHDLRIQPSNVPVSIFLPGTSAFMASKNIFDPERNMRAICSYQTDGPSTRQLVNDTGEERIRYVPAGMYPFTSEIRVYANKAVFLAEKEEFAVIIQSEDVAGVMLQLFELAWEEAGREDARIRKTLKQKRATQQ